MLDSLDADHRRALARLAPDRAELVLAAVLDEHAAEIEALRQRVVDSLERRLGEEKGRRGAA